MPDETSASDVEGIDVAWLDEHVELDLTGSRRPDADEEGDSASADDVSARASVLAGDHWRERAVIWRERALAAEMVAKMLQRNLDDLRLNLEDLRREAIAVAAANELETASHRTGSETPPWRRFVRDLYDKYLR